jgi:putative nucleotidyltransferase with HDIG domain
MPMTRGRLGFVALGLAVVAAGTIGELERLSLMSSGLFPPWGPAAAAGTVGKLERLSPTPALFFASSPSAAHSLQAWALQRPLLEWLGIVAYIALIVWVASLYLERLGSRSLEQSEQPHHLWLLPPLLLLLVVGAALSLTSTNSVLPYLFPVPAFSIALAVAIDTPLSVLVTVLAGLAMGYTDNASLALTTYVVIGGLVGALSLKWAERKYRLLWSGIYVALSNVVVVLIFRLSGGESDSLELAQLLVVGIANGILSAGLASIGFFATNVLLGHTSSLQLLQLAQPSQPVLRELLQHAPGTYHHSLMVSSLAEQAAEQVGADALLVRVGGLYHDMGKMLQPEYFIENQQVGNNGHDQLDPRSSAQIIIGHVKKGLDLARKYGLPREVHAFIAEHHGTTLVQFFYHQAMEQAGDPAQVDEADFRYPGPRPRSKETALVMLADSCEAAVRAENPASVEEMVKIVEGIITDKANSGELDESGLTVHELNVIRDTFARMFQGVLHHRVKYPKEETEQPAEQAAVPSVPVADRPHRHLVRDLLTRLGL